MDTPRPSRCFARVPYLALKHVAGSDRPIFFSISEKNAINVDGPGELENHNSWATPQGWVLVRDAAASSTYLLDPIDRSVRIPLPHLPEDDLPCCCTCLLSDYPDLAADAGKNCLVLLIHTNHPVFWYCHVGVDGDDWVKHEYDIGTLPLPDLSGCGEKILINPIAACQGRFYFDGGFDKLGVLEFSPAPVLSFIAIPEAIEEPYGLQKVILVESQQELFKVSLVSGMDVGVVYRVHSKPEWVEADDLGGRVFLLSPWYFGASRSASECGLEPDCIYAVYPWKKRVVIFNVKDGTMIMQDLDDAPESQQALWLLPTHP